MKSPDEHLFPIKKALEKLARKHVRRLLNLLKRSARIVVSNLPISIQSILASRGYPHYCSKDINYVGCCFNTKFMIQGNTKYQIEINATSKKIPGHEVFPAIAEILRPLSVCIDVGANIGSYSIGMVGLGAAKVFALEPGPYFNRLRENIILNKLDEKIEAFQIGITETESEFGWTEDLNNLGNAHLISKSVKINTESTNTNLSGPVVKVNCVQLDKFVSEHILSKIDLIKIDVELMELEVLKSGIETIRKNRPILVVETSSEASKMRGHNTVAELFQFLNLEGYQGFDFRENTFKEVNSSNHGRDTIFLHNSYSLKEKRKS